MLDKLEKRMKKLAEDLEQSAATHNALVGSMRILKELHDDISVGAVAAEDVAEVIEGVVESV